MAQATTDIPTFEDLNEVTKRRARLAVETIASFDAYTSDDRGPTTSYDSPQSAGAAYLYDVAARPARERRGIRLGVVHMVNDTDILVVSRTRGNATRVAPRCVMMDSGAQPVMIGKKLAQELGLAAEDLAPCPFTIVTSVGHVERATCYTQEPLQLSFRVKPGDPPAPLLLRCAVTDATNYDILVGQQALYPLGFGLDNWTEEAWIRPGWSAGDGRKELIPVAFAAAATIAPLSMVFGCGAMVDTLPYGSALLEELLAFMGSTDDQRDMVPKGALVCHPKDPLPPWRDSAELFRRCEDIVHSLTPRTPVIPDVLSTLAHPILWQPPNAGITLVELFEGIGTGLAVVLEVSLTVRRYIYVDNSPMSTRVARHHLHQLMFLYLQQLPPTAIHGCFSRLPRDVTVISEADLRHLGPVDMVIVGWPCQGHSRAGAGRG